MRPPDFEQRVSYQTFGEKPLEPVTVQAVRRMWKLVHPTKDLARPDLGATIGTWLLDCPGAHPFWQWYFVAAIHLRAIEGVAPAHITRKGATHEVMVMALQPPALAREKQATRELVETLCDGDDYDADLVDRAMVQTRGALALPYMTPFDVVQQVVAKSDQIAAQAVFLCVRACCVGQLSPDSDFRSAWARMLDDTIRHYEEGKHAIG